MMIGSRDVLKLTGLSSNQLREWTVRRGLIQPDMPPQGRGSEGKFSWQTVLLLRLAMVLKSRFHVELQAHRELFSSARGHLQKASFLSLWGCTLAVHELGHCELLSPHAQVPAGDDVILLRLNSHLEILSQQLDSRAPISQLPLFPTLQVPEPVQETESAVVREVGRA